MGTHRLKMFNMITLKKKCYNVTRISINDVLCIIDIPEHRTHPIQPEPESESKLESAPATKKSNHLVPKVVNYISSILFVESRK